MKNDRRHPDRVDSRIVHTLPFRDELLAKCHQREHLLLDLANHAWPCLKYQPQLHGGWPHQVCTRLVLWFVKTEVQEDVSLVSGGHRPADQQQHDNRSEPGPAGRHRGPDSERIAVQLADVPGRGRPTTERHQAVPTLPVSTTAENEM